MEGESGRPLLLSYIPSFQFSDAEGVKETRDMQAGLRSSRLGKFVLCGLYVFALTLGGLHEENEMDLETLQLRLPKVGSGPVRLKFAEPEPEPVRIFPRSPNPNPNL